MFNRSILLATAFFVLSTGAASRAATMSSDASTSGAYEPPVANHSELTEPGDVETQASAYFFPPEAGSSTPDSDDGFMTVEEERNKRRKGAIAWLGSGVALGNFFLSTSEFPPIDIPSEPLEPGPGVAPVPELSSGMLVILALGGLGATGVGRKHLRRSRAIHAAI